VDVAGSVARSRAAISHLDDRAASAYRTDAPAPPLRHAPTEPPAGASEPTPALVPAPVPALV
jgi:hypothetical protein